VGDRLSRHGLTDEEWQRLLPMMPGDARQGRRWSDHRMVIDGILFRTRTGCPWRDLPGEYGNWKTVYNRHRRWSGDGTWERIQAVIPEPADQVKARLRKGGKGGGPPVFDPKPTSSATRSNGP
jgi:transposase